MTHASSEEEIKAMRSDFGLRLSSSMAQYGPLCVGIDPHRKNLTDWGYNVDAEGAELFSMRMLQAMRDRAAAVKFQEPCSSATGPRDSRRSNECSTPLVKWASSPSWTASMEACPPPSPPSRTHTSSRAPLCWPTPSPCCRTMAHAHCGASPMSPQQRSRRLHRSLTSNQEGASMQTAIRQSGDFKGKTVAFGIASTAQKFNDDIDGMGSVGSSSAPP